MSLIAARRTAVILLATLVAIPATITAQETYDRPLMLACAMDRSGMDIHVANTYPGGVIAILASPNRGSMPLPLWLGGGGISVGSPVVLVALDLTGEDYDLALHFDTKVFADLNITVYAQAVSIDTSIFRNPDEQVSAENPAEIMISNLMKVDFAAEYAAALAGG